MSSKYFIIPIFVPHLGCPHDCVFCNQDRITGLSTDVRPEDVEKIIEDHLATFPKGEKTVEVAFFGGSFTGIEKDIQEKLLRIPYEYKKNGKIDAIRLSTRPDYIDDNILNLLSKYTVDTVELGVQSMDQDVLDKSGRGHSVESIYRAADLIKKYKMNLGLQMMVGLVGDSPEKSIDTACRLIDLKPYCVRVYPTLVIKDTYLEKLYVKEKYKALSLDDAVDVTTDILMLFDYNDIDVIRMGLQPTEKIQLGEDVIAGPFHPSFRQLVESNILKKIVSESLTEYKIENLEELIIKVDKRKVSDLAGQKSSNIRYFKERYGIKKIRIYGEDMEEDIIEFKLKEKEFKISVKEYRERYLRFKNLI